MTKIRITEPCFVDGKPLSVGDVIELDKVAAADLLASGRCEVASGYDRRGAVEVEHRDPEATDRDPKPATKRARKAKDVPSADSGTDAPAGAETGESGDAGATGDAPADPTDPAAE